MISDPAFYLAAIPAVILVGFAKGGFAGLGLLALPLMALTISPVQALAIMLPILMVQDVVTVWSYRHSWDKTNIQRLLPGALLGIAAGYFLAAYVSEDAVALTIGVVSVSFAMRRLVLERRATLPAASVAGPIGGAVFGVLSGFTSMVAHAGGPPFQVYVPAAAACTARSWWGPAPIFFAILNVVKVAPFFMLGQFSPENLATSLALFPLAIAATIAGIWLIRRIDSLRFYTLIYILLLGVGGKLIHDGLGGMLG